MHHLGRPLGREEEGAGEDLGDRQQLEFERGDDAEVATGAAHRPEELRVGARVDAPFGPLGVDQLDRGDAVALQAVLAAVPADPTAEAVADDADGRRGAVAGGQALRRGPRDDVAPERPGANPGDPPLRVDRDGVQRHGADQQRVAEVAERFGRVTGPLAADPQPFGLRVVDRIDHVAALRGVTIAAGSWLSSTLKAPQFRS